MRRCVPGLASLLDGLQSCLHCHTCLVIWAAGRPCVTPWDLYCPSCSGTGGLLCGWGKEHPEADVLESWKPEQVREGDTKGQKMCKESVGFCLYSEFS